MLGRILRPNDHKKAALFFVLYLLLTGVFNETLAGSLLVKNAELITVSKSDNAVFRGFMFINSEGRIEQIGPGEPPAELQADEVLDALGKVVAPGFISAHSHIYMSPLRGLGHDENLYGWFRAWSRYLQHTTSEDIYWFTLHGAIDFLRNGITTAYDFTYSGVVREMVDDPKQKRAAGRFKNGPFEENQIKAKTDAGLRFVNSVGMPEIGSDEDIIGRFAALWETYEKSAPDPQFLKLAISGAQQFNPDPRTARLEAAVMKKFGVINQSHFLESPNEVLAQQEKFQWYDDAGVLGPQIIFGHFIHTNDNILSRVVETGSKMSWQPTSNGRLGDGIADVVTYRKMGIPVAVGLDDQSCTDVSDPFQNMRIGLYTMRGIHKNAKALSVHDMLYLHTLGSAEVLGIDEQVGSLEVGKYADFVIVDLRQPDTGPVYDVLASYVLASSLRNLKAVYVGGSKVVQSTKILTFDETRVREEIDRRTNKVRELAQSLDAPG